MADRTRGVPHLLGYKCSICGADYALDEVAYVCPKHGDLGNLDVVLDYAAINRDTSPATISASRDTSIWRYLPLLPVGNPGLTGTPLRAVGGTPLYAGGQLAAGLGLPRVWVKDDGRNPTASFKDRASAVAVARALEIAAPVITTASTGNAGAALAAMAAAAKMQAVIFAPETAPAAKVAQLLIFGARVLLVKGNYDQAFDLALQASREFGWHCRNTGYNPFTAEGKKTASFEICEQLTRAEGGTDGAGWAAPDWIFVSVGDGNIISGIYKGLVDLRALGWMERMPKLMAVQAEGSAAVYNTWRAGADTITPVRATTLADSIAVDLPRDGLRAVRAVRETGGACLLVSDEEILTAMRELGRGLAVFAEPAGATAWAGLAKAARESLVRPDERIVVMNTGNGLKDVSAAMKAAGDAVRIEPNLEEVKRLVGA